MTMNIHRRMQVADLYSGIPRDPKFVTRLKTSGKRLTLKKDMI